MTQASKAERAKQHRYFAVECNNRAWDLADLPERSAEEAREMLRCAAASAWHWSQVGGAIQQARADMLQGWVNAVTNRPADARHHADSSASLLRQHSDEASEWDSAFQRLLEARTRVAETDPARYAEALSTLDEARNLLSDTEEQQTFDRYRQALPTSL